MRRLRNEDGFALVSAVIIVVILIGLGIALLAYTDVQQSSSTRQQSRETAYSIAEAALNSQIFQLSLNWPTDSQSKYPTSCNPGNAATTAGCPNLTNMSSAYPASGSTNCPNGTPTDAWSPGSTSEWSTYVRADGGGTGKLFNSATDETQNTYDSGGSGGSPDGNLWVRATGFANCRLVTVISKVSVQYVALNFPQDAVIANAFATSNNGNKIIVNTQGSNAPQPGLISVRCNGLAGGPPWPGSACTNYRAGQVSPDTTGAPASPAQTLSPFQLASLKAQAQNNNTYWPSGSCPSSISQLTGQPTYIEGPCALSFTGNGQANTASSPGFTVLVNGTIEFNGTVTFYGEVYAVDAQGAGGTPCSGSDVVTAHGNATVQGAIDVDGNGTVCFGSSSFNFVYDPTVYPTMKGWGGAVGTPNTFRELPDGQ